ncbi:MAG: putative sulfate exporter family transporter, partial [Brachybacterium sp.]
MSLSTTSAPPLQRHSLWPGIVVSLAVAAVSILTSQALPGVSALIIAIVVGILVANFTTLPAALAPGMSFAAKRLLRVGIVLLGLQVALGDLLALGAPMLAVVVV